MFVRIAERRECVSKIISCSAVAALLLTFLPAPAHAVTLTAINDSILPLDESTMPARLGGETYVPYSVFYHARRVSLGE